MITGYNHNIRYQNRVFHVQTEDSGRNNPRIMTHLFVGGNIIATLRSSYEELLQEGLDEVALETEIKSRMKEQHKEMIKELKAGKHVERAKLFPDAKHAETHTVINSVATITKKKKSDNEATTTSLRTIPQVNDTTPLKAIGSNDTTPMETLAHHDSSPPTQPSLPASPSDFQHEQPVFEDESKKEEKSSSMHLNTGGRFSSPYRQTSSMRPGFQAPPGRSSETADSEKTSVPTSLKDSRETSPMNLFRRTRPVPLQRPGFQAPPPNRENRSEETEEVVEDSTGEETEQQNKKSTTPLRPVLNLKRAPRAFTPPTKEKS